MDTTDTTIHVLICSTSLRGNALFIQESGILEVPPGGGRLIQVLEVNGGWGLEVVWALETNEGMMIDDTSYQVGGGNSYFFIFTYRKFGVS